MSERGKKKLERKFLSFSSPRVTISIFQCAYILCTRCKEQSSSVVHKRLLSNNKKWNIDNISWNMHHTASFLLLQPRYEMLLLLLVPFSLFIHSHSFSLGRFLKKNCCCNWPCRLVFQWDFFKLSSHPAGRKKMAKRQKGENPRVLIVYTICCLFLTHTFLSGKNFLAIKKVFRLFRFDLKSLKSNRRVTGHLWLSVEGNVVEILRNWVING